MSPRETRAGCGPADGPVEVERAVGIFARRAIRADHLAVTAPDPYAAGLAAGRHEAYLQAIAELLGVEMSVVRVAYRARVEPFTAEGATRAITPPALTRRRRTPARAVRDT